MSAVQDPPPPPTAEPTLDPQRLNRALERHRSEFEKIPPEQFVAISVDVAAAAMLVLKRWPTWLALMPRIRALPEVNMGSIQNLEGTAEATLQAHADYVTSVAPPTELEGTLEEADSLRDSLRGDAEVLERRKLLPAGSLGEVRGLPGYRNTAVDLSALVSVLEKAWPNIESKTAITREELDRASVLAQHIFRNAVEREGRQPRQIETTRLRQQAFTALSRSYEQLRRCITFLFPNPGEAEEIAPSFYQGRGGRPPLRPEQSQPVNPTPVNPAPATPGLVTAGLNTAGPVDGTLATPGGAPSNPNALPSRSPFTS